MQVDPQSPPEPAARQRRVFLSYARQDAAKVRTLEDGLRSFGVDVWLDNALVGGHEWWHAILKEIRERDVFVQAVSPTAIDSEACTREREYAQALGKPTLPVVVDDIDTDLLPDDLSRLQLVAYIEPTAEHAFRLAHALASCPQAPPLPDPLPAPPDVPVSYLQGLHARVRAPTLSFDEQLALVGRLETALDREGDRTDAVKLLLRMSERNDLYHAVAVRIDRLLSMHVPDPDRGPDPGPRDRDRDRDPDPEPRALGPIALTCFVLVIAALAALPGGALRDANGPDDSADATTQLLALALVRTLGWALIVAAVSAVVARHTRSARPRTAAVRGLAAGAVAGLAGALVHSVLVYQTDAMSSQAARLVGLAVTGAVAGVYFGQTLRARVAGLIGGLAGGLLAGALVYNWPGRDAPFVDATSSWTLHSVPICVGAIGLAVIVRAIAARRSAPVAHRTTVLRT